VKIPLSPLRLARLRRGATQFELALQAKLPASRLSLLERGLSPARADERRRLASTLGDSESELFPEVQWAEPRQDGNDRAC
jgi:transcriptional regulator with XRE-family HTH domain